MLHKFDFYKRMLSLAIPIALQQLLTSCAAMIDTAMVVGLGNISTAAIGVAVRWTFILNIALFGVSSGVATITAQYWGMNDRENIRRTFGTGMVCALPIGLLFAFCTRLIPREMMLVFTREELVIRQGVLYLQNVSLYGVFFSLVQVLSTSMRSTENVRIPLLCAIVSVLSNTFMNYLLIGGHLGFPALGLQGAALATTIATFIQMTLLLTLGRAKKEIVCSHYRQIFGLNRQFVRSYLLISIPVLINELGWGVGTNVYSMVFARQGSDNYAAYTIFNSFDQVLFSFFVGICSACSIMLGKSVGAGKSEEAYHMGKRFIGLIIAMGLGIGASFLALRYPLLGLMPIETEQVRQTAARIMAVYALWLPIRNIPYICIVGIFRAGGDTRTGMYLDISALFLISIPTVYVLGFYTDIAFPALVAAMYIAEDSLKVTLCLIHFFRRRWIRKITVDKPAALAK